MSRETISTCGQADKLQKLREILTQMGSVLIAYSGGVDSTFLLKVAADALGENVLAVTATSPTYTRDEYDRARQLADSLGVEHLTIRSNEIDDADFCRNSPQRCYYCKGELFGRLRRVAEQRRVKFVLDASNVDDCADFRPGRKAARELGVRSPLVEAGICKEEIRSLSKQMGLSTWDRPAMACLASRFPYGEEITADKLRAVEQAEKFLRDLGCRNVRVRSHGDLARIEVDAEGVCELAETGSRERIVEALKRCGFVYVALDLEGYRSGSLNETLSAGQRAGNLQAQSERADG